ncbi:hypothetical protein ACFL57_00835 [Candidatus Margulisiibacteriota bacterium]
MKIKKILIIVIVLGVCLNSFAVDQSGGFAGSLLSWGVGARAISMGRTYLAAADEASAAYWNASAMSQVERRSVTTMYSDLMGYSSLAFMGLVWPTVGNDTWGLSFVQLSSAEFEKTLTSAASLGTFSVSQQSIGLAYSRQINENISLGAGANMFSNSVDTESDSAMLLDVSALYKLGNFKFAGVIKNIFSSAEKDEYPLILKGGISSMFLDGDLLFSFDVSRIAASPDLEWGIGGEYAMWKNYSLRGGAHSGEIYGGAGMRLDNFDVDFAAQLGEVGLSYFISLNMYFGDSRVLSRDKLIKDSVAKLNGQMKAGDFKEAYKTASYILKLDATNITVKKYSLRLEVLNNIYEKNLDQQDMSREKIKEMLIFAGNDYLNGYNQRAVNKLEYAVYLQPEQNPIAKALLTELKQTADEEELGGKDIVGEKLQESLVLFYSSKFKEVIDVCDEVIQLEPQNIDAHLRKGSAHFMRVEEEEAIEAWKRALEIDPTKKDELDQIIQKLRQTRTEQLESEQSGQTEQIRSVLPSISLGVFNSRGLADQQVEEALMQGVMADVEDSGTNSFRVVVKPEGRSYAEMQDIFDDLNAAGVKAFWLR